MASEARTDDIELAALLLDSDNPRHDVLTKQREIVGAMLDGPDSHQLLVLARTIVTEGLSPAERLIVMPHDTDKKAFVVLEGNRRAAALKLLDSPALIGASKRLSRPMREEWGTLARKYEGTGPIQKIACCIFDTRQEANFWLKLKHTGMNEGAGTVGWGPEEIARFKERFFGRKPKELALLDFAKEKSPAVASIPSGKKAFPFTTFKRLVPQVCKQWGITYHDQTIHVPKRNSENAIDGISKIIKDLSTGDVKVEKLMSRAQRVEYVQKVAKGRTDGPPVPEPKTPRPSRREKPSPYLIPADCAIVIPHPRLREIFTELQTELRVEEGRNAVGVLFRVFVELSMDEYVEKHNVQLRPQLLNPRDNRLKHKFQGVFRYMKIQKILTEHQLKPIRSEASREDGLFSPDTLNAYVHNPDFEPDPLDLRRTWGRSRIFIETLWR